MTEQHEKLRAQNEGRGAYLSKDPVSSNPYQPDEPLFFWWRTGWCQQWEMDGYPSSRDQWGA